MASIPYTAVLEGQFREARRIIEAGNDLAPMMIVIGRSALNAYDLPAPTEDREAWAYKIGKANALMSAFPQAALIRRDLPAPSDLFATKRQIVLGYQDGDGLRRGQRLTYTAPDLVGPAFDNRAESLADSERDDMTWLDQFWRGFRFTTQQYIDNRSRTKRRPSSWRFYR